jgi:hypothetical protein
MLVSKQESSDQVEQHPEAGVPQPEPNGHVEQATEPVVPPPESDSDDQPETVSEFTFVPKDGSDPITVPGVATAIPEGRQRWFFWKLRKLQGLEQPIFWLEQAGIPDPVQERIMLLGDGEWARFYDEWMHQGAGASPGE